MDKLLHATGDCSTLGVGLDALPVNGREGAANGECEPLETRLKRRAAHPAASDAMGSSSARFTMCSWKGRETREGEGEETGSRRPCI